MRGTEDREKGCSGCGGCAKCAEGAEGAKCSEGVWSMSIQPAEDVEPVEDQNAEELLKIVHNPKIAELCNVINCLQMIASYTALCLYTVS